MQCVEQPVLLIERRDILLRLADWRNRGRRLADTQQLGDLVERLHVVLVRPVPSGEALAHVEFRRVERALCRRTARRGKLCRRQCHQQCAQ